MGRIIRSRLLIATALAGISAQAQAQTVEPASDGYNENEIVVTARKRSELLQDVPAAITAISQDALDIRSLQNVADFRAAVPNFSAGNFSDSVVVTIRGVGSNVGLVSGESSVAFHVDNVYRKQLRSFNAAMYDIERVEVARGPQGSLFGRNATGGSINIISRRPQNKFEAGADFLYGNYDNTIARGYVNIPLIDGVLASRFSGYYEKRDGFNLNNRVVTTLRNTDDADVIAGRGQLLLTPSDALTVTIIGDYFRFDGAGPGSDALAGPALSPTRPVGTTDDPRVFDLNTQSFRETEQYGVSAQIEYDFGGVGARYIGSYREDNLNGSSYDVDYRGTRLPIIPFPIDLTENIGFSKTDEQSHELQLYSDNPDSPLEWLIGAYYFKQNLFSGGGLRLRISSPPLAPPFTPGFGTSDTKSQAVFGHVGYQLSETVQIEGGLRYSDESFGETERTGTGPITVLQPYNSDDVNWEAGINFKPRPGSLIYAKVSNAFKLGGRNPVGIPPALAPAAYADEKVQAYEIGTKNSFMDGRMTLNLTGFYYDYKNLQLISGVVDPVTLVVSAPVRNVPKSRVWGLELEGVAQLSPSVSFDLNISYLNAKLRRYFSADSALVFVPALLIPQDLTGNRLPNSPEFSLTAGLQKRWDLGGAGSLTTRLQTYFQTESFMREFNLRIERQPAYTKTDFRLIYTDASERYSVEGFVNNIENDDVLVSAASLPTALYGNYAPPRTYGVRVGVRF